MQTLELTAGIEEELINLKDRCWLNDKEIDEKSLRDYREKVEELHRKGYSVNVFLAVAFNLEQKARGFKSHKGVTIKKRMNGDLYRTRPKGAIDVTGIGLMIPQGHSLGCQIYIGRNPMDNSEIIEVWLTSDGNKYIEVKYTKETEENDERSSFLKKDKLLRKKGL